MKRDTANPVGDTTEGVMITESAIFVQLNRTWTPPQIVGGVLIWQSVDLKDSYRITASGLDYCESYRRQQHIHGASND